jgi:hypothetical protein
MRSLLGRFHRPFARGVDEQLLLLNNLGDGSTLSLDFTTGVLDPRLTFTRSTTGTFTNASGLVASAAINTPRFDYDPTTLQPRGLLIEGSASNLATYSNLQAAWAGGTNTTVTANTTEVVSPDGTNNAAKVALTNTGYCSRFESISGLAASTTYTFSYWIRGTAGNQQRVYSSTASTDLVTQTTLSYSTSGWTRVQITFTTTAVISTVFIYVVSRPTGTASDVVYIWGVQLEAGTGASSLIPTGASTGNRALDHCYATGANFTSWFSTGAGTVVAVSDNTKNNTQNLTANISDGTTNNYVRMGFKVGGASNEYLLTTVGGPAAFQGAADSGYAPALNTVYKMAYAWDTNNFAIVANGGAVATDTSGTLAGAGVLTQLVIGGDFVASPLDIYFKNGHIRSLKYYPTRLPNAQLQALTT